MNSQDLPYYLAGLPVLFDEPQPNAPAIRRPETQRLCFWVASLGPALIAGHTHHRLRDVRAWLLGAGFTEPLVTHDLLDVVDIVAELRAAHRAGRRAGIAGAVTASRATAVPGTHAPPSSIA